MGYKVWGKCFYGSLVLPLALIATINIVADPYGIHNIPVIPMLTHIKPELDNHRRMTKAHRIKLVRPQLVAFGNSRVERGINIDHPILKETSPRYNCGLQAGSIYEVLRYFEHANHYGVLKVAIVGLDFEMFNMAREPNSDFSEALLYSEGSTNNDKELFVNKLQSVFSLSALYASQKTIIASFNNKSIRHYQENGAASIEYNNDIIKRHGYLEAFLKYEKNYLEKNLSFSFISTDGRSSFDYFALLLELARHSNTELKLYISPVHARMLSTIKFAGHWQYYEEWKRNLVKVIETNNRANPDKKMLQLLDFSGYTEITKEPVPFFSNIPEDMIFYWDSSHFRETAGNSIIQTLFVAEPAVSPTFYSYIDKNSIESHLAQIRKEQQRYMGN